MHTIQLFIIEFISLSLFFDLDDEMDFDQWIQRFIDNITR
jgi:hypothetical protein